MKKKTEEIIASRKKKLKRSGGRNADNEMETKPELTPLARIDALYERAKEFLDSDTVSAQATKTTLALLIASGVLTAIIVAPGLTVLARHYRRSKYHSDTQMYHAVENLKKGRFIVESKYNDGKPRIRLTVKGEAYFQKILFEDVKLPQLAKWDEKWRFVLFDIPMKYTEAREALRFRLKALGFYQYQKSAWVCPHPCEKEILYVADYFRVGKFVEILEVTHLSNDENIKKHFKL